MITSINQASLVARMTSSILFLFLLFLIRAYFSNVRVLFVLLLLLLLLPLLLLLLLSFCLPPRSAGNGDVSELP